MTAMGTTRAGDGFELWYAVDGEGPGIVFPSRSQQEHEALAAELGASHRVARYIPRDVPAAGWDAPALEAYPTDLVVADLHAVADAAGIGEFTLGGYSGTAAMAAFLAPVSDRATGLVAGGFPILGPHDYWLGVLDGTRSGLVGAGQVEQARQVWLSVLLYLAWAERDDRTALRALPGPKVALYGSGDGEPGCAMHAGMRGSTIARRLRAQASELRELGFEVIEVPGHDHLGTQQATDVVAEHFAKVC